MSLLSCPFFGDPWCEKKGRVRDVSDCESRNRLFAPIERSRCRREDRGSCEVASARDYWASSQMGEKVREPSVRAPFFFFFFFFGPPTIQQ